MSMIITQPAQAISLPAPRVAIDVRPATLDDFAFIDRLQTAYAKQLGYMPRAQMESKIRAGHVLVAEGSRSLVVPLSERSDRWASSSEPTATSSATTAESSINFASRR